MIRGGYGRSFGAVTTVTGSTHQRGFTQTFGVPDQGTNGILPNDPQPGFPDYPIPPFIDPSFANKDNIPWWQGKEATRLPEQNFWNLSIQRQFSGSTVLEVSYNALVGSHLQTQLLNVDQVDPKYLTQYGNTLLNSSGELSGRDCSRVQSPYPTFTVGTCPALDACWGSGATVARALRPSCSSPGWTPTEVAATIAGTPAITPASSAWNAGRAKG